jgi:hypothetical protein
LGDCLLWPFFENYSRNPNSLGGFFSTVKVIQTLILTKNELDFILVDFFTNSSGHLGKQHFITLAYFLGNDIAISD